MCLAQCISRKHPWLAVHVLVQAKQGVIGFGVSGIANSLVNPIRTVIPQKSVKIIIHALQNILYLFRLGCLGQYGPDLLPTAGDFRPEALPGATAFLKS